MDEKEYIPKTFQLLMIYQLARFCFDMRRTPFSGSVIILSFASQLIEEAMIAWHFDHNRIDVCPQT